MIACVWSTDWWLHCRSSVTLEAHTAFDKLVQHWVNATLSFLFDFLFSNQDWSYAIRLWIHTPNCVSLLCQSKHFCLRAKRLYKLTCSVSPTGTATEYSKKCCETLVSAGAVDILLKQIHLLNRGIPDQEVLKQVFLTLRNLARYPNLRQVLINTPESAEIIFQELLRYLIYM